jgi:hypothetical protein
MEHCASAPICMHNKTNMIENMMEHFFILQK